MRMANVLVAVLLTVPSLARADDPSPKPTPDALDEALQQVGLTRGDLGWKPKGWWINYPGDIPFKLRCFDDLFAEPLATVTHLRTMAQAVRVCLDPATLDHRDDRLKYGGQLFRLTTTLGVNQRMGTLRTFAANLHAPETPLKEAILTVHRTAGRPTSFIQAGVPSPYPNFEKELTEQTKDIPAEIQPILGQLILNVLDAQHWADLALRNVPGNQRIAVARKVNIGEEEVDALDYEPAFDDVARTIDDASLYYAGLKCVQALDDARIALKSKLAELSEPPKFSLDWESPYGWIRFRGVQDDTVDGNNAWLIVDLGGNDTYLGPVGASAVDRSIGLLLDLSGDDHYISEQQPAQGAGITGAGILLDVSGNDHYEAQRMSQGFGQFGLGLCIDLGGDDEYFVKYSGQGCGYFGIGMLFDGGGRDRYKLYADGQGLGGVAGIGVLADFSGDDTYEAVRDSAITGRGSYHNPNQNISVSNAQGCAMGRRGDIGDGHSWAGGLGALIDLSGNDHYRSGNWSMGTGYWFGIGYLYDGEGNDVYEGVGWSMATGAHFCIGVLLDESGNDQYLAQDQSHQSLAWGHDFTIALLVDGGGDDVYQSAETSPAYAINRSVAMLLDLGGNDSYLTKPENRPGSAIFDEKMRDRTGLSTYFADSTSLALFLDVGGTDRYNNTDARDNTTWLDPPDSPNGAVRNFSVGVDRAEGSVSFLPCPEKPLKR